MKRYQTVLAITCLTAATLHAGPTVTIRNIFPPQAKHVHASSIVECPNGDLLACWFHGSGERNADDVKIQGARLRKGATEWSPVFVMADTPNFPDCNPVLYIDRNEKLWLFWVPVLAGRWECCMLKYRTATDYQSAGPPKWSWQDIIQLKPGPHFREVFEAKFKELPYHEGMWAEYAKPYRRLLLEAAKDSYKRQTGWMTRIHPLTLPSGRILLPLYSDGFNVSLAAISDDDGETWRASTPIIGLGPIQPTLVRKKSGHIVAYCRDSGDAPNRVLKSVSTDDGETWSVALDTEIPNPDSSLEAITLADGTWFLICNDTDDSRGRLTVMLSNDEGKTWKWKRVLEPSDKIGRTFAYPSVIQARDGSVHVTYSYTGSDGDSIRHAMLTTEWIKARK